MEDIVSKLKGSQILLVLMPKSNYNEKLIEITNDFTKVCDRICYISMNKPYKTITNSFKKNKISLEKFFFIDTISKCDADEGIKSMKNCFFISSPSAFSELGIVYSKVLKSNFCGMIFDSVSTLHLYGKGDTPLQLLHSLINKAREKENKAIIFASTEDRELEVVKNLYLFVDEVIEVKDTASPSTKTKKEIPLVI